MCVSYSGLETVPPSSAGEESELSLLLSSPHPSIRLASPVHNLDQSFDSLYQSAGHEVAGTCCMYSKHYITVSTICVCSCVWNNSTGFLTHRKTQI